MTTKDGQRLGVSALRPGRWAAAFAALLLAAAITVAGVASASGRGRSTSGPDLGAFSGEMLPVPDLHSVLGSWVVPRALPQRAAGDASVWIGAQAPGPAPTAPFIQVGVNVIHDPGGHDAYLGFWTDTLHAFHPRQLLVVHPGDRLTAGLVLRGGRWTVTLEDLTRGTSARRVTADEGAARFSAAEWLQEDPARNASVVHRRRIPYVETSEVRFSALLANGRPPAPAAMLSTWMSLPGTDLAPTAVRENGFAVVHRRLRPGAQRDVLAARPEDAAMSGFLVALGPWLRGGPASGLASAATRLRTALAALRTALRAGGWPRSSANARAAVAAVDPRLIAQLRRARRLPTPARAAWDRVWQRLASAAGGDGRALRAALGAPEVVEATP